MVELVSARDARAGDDVGERLALPSLWEHGAACSVDLLGEATVTSAEADSYAARCMDALIGLSRISAGWPAREVLERDSIGRLARANVSVKVSALTPLLRPRARCWEMPIVLAVLPK